MSFLKKIFGGSSEEEERARIARENQAKFERLAKMAEGMTYDKETALDNLRKASEISPEIAGLYEALQQDPTMMEQLETDPRFQDIMQGNLETIQEMAEESGFTEEDMAKRKELQRATAADAKARDKSIVREMMQRGQAGSGTELLARLGSSQAAAQRQAESSDRMAIESAAARKAALQQASQQASAMQQSQFSQGADKARAADTRNLNNLLRRQSAQDKNLGLKQGLANLTAQQKSNYYQQAAQLEQQDYANKLSKLGAISGAQGMASQYAMQGVAPKTNWGQIVGTVAGAAIGSKAGPAGATAGASIGGAVGGAVGADGGIFNQGGIKKKALDNISNRQAPMFSMQQESEPTAAEQIAAFNSLQRQYRYNIGGVKQERVSKQEQAPKQSGMSNEDLGALLGAMAKSMRPEREGRRYSEGGKESSIPERKVPQEPDFIDRVTGGIQNMFTPSKPEFEESEMDYSAAYDKAKKEDRLNESPDKIKKEMKEEDNRETVAALQAISKGMAGAKKKAPLAKVQNTLVDPKVTSYDITAPQKLDFNIGRGINAADGAVKMTPEEMRDSLVQEVSAFACGGVKHGKKYEEGGISPELKQASQMLRTNNQPAPAAPMPGNQPPMPAPPMDPNMMPPQAPQMPPQGAPMDPAMLPPQGAPMPPQGQMMADGGMAYEDGGEGTIIPGENYEGDELPDRINSGEMVLNVEQQDRLNDQLMELKRLKSKERTDKMLADGTAEVNPMQQESLMAFVRGEIEVDDLPNERVVKEPTIGEPSGRMAELLGMLGKKRRG